MKRAASTSPSFFCARISFTSSSAVLGLGGSSASQQNVEIALGAALLAGTAAMVLRYWLDRRSGQRRTGAIEAIRVAVVHRHGLAVADVRLLKAGAIPRTTSGKLARLACRTQYLSAALGGR